MPHYATKREAKIGDMVMAINDPGEYRAIGVILSINANSSSCNAQLMPAFRKWAKAGAWMPAPNGWPECVTLGDCVPIDLEHFELIRHESKAA